MVVKLHVVLPPTDTCPQPCCVWTPSLLYHTPQRTVAGGDGKAHKPPVSLLRCPHKHASPPPGPFNLSVGRCPRHPARAPTAKGMGMGSPTPPHHSTATPQCHRTPLPACLPGLPPHWHHGHHAAMPATEAHTTPGFVVCVCVGGGGSWCMVAWPATPAPPPRRRRPPAVPSCHH